MVFRKTTEVEDGENPDPDKLSEDLDKSAKENVGKDDTCSITDGWSDVIREQNGYTLSSGSHIKLSTSFFVVILRFEFHKF